MTLPPATMLQITNTYSGIGANRMVGFGLGYFRQAAFSRVSVISISHRPCGRKSLNRASGHLIVVRLEDGFMARVTFNQTAL